MEENKVDASLEQSDNKTTAEGENNSGGEGQQRERKVREPREPREPRESRNREPKEIVETRISGTVKWYNVRDGYGFINRDSNNVDYFIHFSGIGIANPDHWQRSLEDGEKVLFDISKGNEKGKEAVNVTGPDGGQVQGSRFALDRTRKPPKYILRGWQVPPKFLRGRRQNSGEDGEDKDHRRRRSETYEEANGEQKTSKKRSQKQRRRRQNKNDEEGKNGQEPQSENENRDEKTRKP
uniref:CSD domain-containing protein n=1 Tax=Plectus sambesii TaxID=2011161 RepID=A0A914XVJ3_9BILA